MFASQCGHLDVVKELLDRGADVEKVNTSDGTTSLMFASQCGHLDVVKELLDRGANINRTGFGVSALAAASAEGHLQIVQYLVCSGASPTITSADGSHTVVSVNMRGWRRDIVCWLCVVSGWPLFRTAVSCMASSPSTIKSLLRRGAFDPDDCAGSLADVGADVGQSGAQEIERLVRLAFGGWSRHSHWLHPARVREAVVTQLIVAARLNQRLNLPVLPSEIWEEILRFLARRHWKVL
jgi:hypothetical protein